MAHWTMDLNVYAEKVGVKVKNVRKAYAFALYSSIVKKTPVGTPPDVMMGGRARGNWHISVGSPDTSVTESTQPAHSDMGSVPEPDGDESIFISNNLPYISTLEYGGYPNPPKGGSGKTVGGYSKQAPNGMVGVTLANNENIFNAAVRSVEGESK